MRPAVSGRGSPGIASFTGYATNEPGGARMRRGTIRLIGWILFIALIDQATGWWARRALAARPIPVWDGHLELHLLFNSGAMLGIGSHYPLLITVVGVVGTVALGIAALCLPRGRWALATMAGGALGNTASRIIFSQVTDFIRVWGYPGIFNLADVALRIGLVWFLTSLVIDHYRPDRHRLDGPT